MKLEREEKKDKRSKKKKEKKKEKKKKGEENKATGPNQDVSLSRLTEAGSLDTLNEKIVLGGFAFGESQETNEKSTKILSAIRSDPLQPLINLLKSHGLLTDRLVHELRSGEEYWALERDLCGALASNGRFDYEDDVLENNFNILRMFVRMYGASAPTALAKYVSEAEEKYDELLKALDPHLSSLYQRRCEEATKEGGKVSAHRFGSWSIPPLIRDEESFRASVMSNIQT
ncbi:hypothetical protein CSA_021622 [Cucumis sativus]|uniref:Uncharacterized protein n=1 Tax=Cucumis sativus TaxID=3659 RepID=A0ACB6HBF8_CUCSA|nr:hypothetical protein CSA_021622 [Cucumis sativus]